MVAHEDDSILFQDPEISREIAAGRCVQTVFVTAGDAGDGSSYWLAREAGARAAYAELMSVPDSWTQTDAGVAGHPIPVFVSTAQPGVSLAFMRLPDGNENGAGYSSTGNRSLEKLWRGSVSSLSAVDGSSTYARSDLISVLGTLLSSAGADRVVTQDFVGTFGDGDHSDHHATAYFTRSASRQYAAPHLLVAFQDYGIANLPANLPSSESTAKENTFFAYAPDDVHVCQTESACQTTPYSAWWQREYLAGAEFSDFAPGSGEPGTTVTLSGSGFTDASGVSFNGVPASFTVDSDTSLTAQVPVGAVTGFVERDDDTGYGYEPATLHGSRRARLEYGGGGDRDRVERERRYGSAGGEGGGREHRRLQHRRLHARVGECGAEGGCVVEPAVGEPCEAGLDHPLRSAERERPDHRRLDQLQ